MGIEEGKPDSYTLALIALALVYVLCTISLPREAFISFSLGSFVVQGINTFYLVVYYFAICLSSTMNIWIASFARLWFKFRFSVRLFIVSVSIAFIVYNAAFFLPIPIGIRMIHMFHRNIAIVGMHGEITYTVFNCPFKNAL